jgi:hypothetical protein
MHRDPVTTRNPSLVLGRSSEPRREGVLMSRRQKDSVQSFGPRAYGERFPDEIAALAEDSGRPLDQLRRLYPFLQTGE